MEWESVPKREGSKPIHARLNSNREGSGQRWKMVSIEGSKWKVTAGRSSNGQIHYLHPLNYTGLPLTNLWDSWPVRWRVWDETKQALEVLRYACQSSWYLFQTIPARIHHLRGTKTSIRRSTNGNNNLKFCFHGKQEKIIATSVKMVIHLR